MSSGDGRKKLTERQRRQVQLVILELSKTADSVNMIRSFVQGMEWASSDLADVIAHLREEVSRS